MRLDTPAILVTIAILLLILAGLIALQFRLSRAHDRWPGLVLPAISLLFAIFAAAGPVITLDASGGPWPAITATVATFLIFNIPTAAFAGIYLHQRERLSVRHELDRMRAQDL